jgi:hypothetical protein
LYSQPEQEKPRQQLSASALRGRGIGLSGGFRVDLVGEGGRRKSWTSAPSCGKSGQQAKQKPLEAKSEGYQISARIVNLSARAVWSESKAPFLRGEVGLLFSG